MGDPVDRFRCSVIVGGRGGRTATPKPNGRAPANPQVLIGSGVSPGVHFSSSLVSPPSKGYIRLGNHIQISYLCNKNY